MIEIILEELGGGDEDDRHLSLGLKLPSWGATSPLVKAALPLIGQLDPQRLDAVLSALRRLEMLHEEGAGLTMPEIVVYH